jgi:hypothetical protein
MLLPCCLLLLLPPLLLPAPDRTPGNLNLLPPARAAGCSTQTGGQTGSLLVQWGFGANACLVLLTRCETQL